VTHQPKVCAPSTEGLLRPVSRTCTRGGSGVGIRTLNLAVNRSTPPVQKWRSVFAECRSVPPFSTVYRRRCCTKPPINPRPKGTILWKFLAGHGRPGSCATSRTMTAYL
jgi:hypothetical protein